MIKIGFHIVGLVAIVAAALYGAQLAGESAFIRSVVADYGYIGIFVTAVFSGFNLAVPVPAIAFLPLFLESGVGYWSVILLIALGVTLADTVAYFIGRVSRHIAARSSEGRALRRLEAIRERYRWAPLAILFVFAVVAPLPNEILVIPLGFLGYRVLHIVPVVFAGNMIFNTLYAAGITSIFELF